ncbi:MAG: rhamnulokinase [Clostridia bacterium]|nr:rhamnulokinase [Clostridia bacterium]
MEKIYCLAVDIGASNGRIMLGSFDGGVIETEVLHRFKNGAQMKNGHLCWDVEMMLREIKCGMKACAERGIAPKSIGIDCFGVDFVLLDQNGNLLGDTVAYRDDRSVGYRENAPLRPDEIFMKNGSLGAWFSSVYQLMYLRENTDHLDKAAYFMHLPDYLNYRLSGIVANELSIAQTSMIINPERCEFDGELLEKMGLPKNIFQKLSLPTSILGRLSPEIVAETGIDCVVVQPCEHDTVSAMAAVPKKDGEDCIFISSGTWSMIGTFLEAPLINEKAIEAGYSNMYLTPTITGLLRGITGLWMVQSIKKELGDEYTFDMLCELSERSDYKDLIDVDDKAFVAPESMIAAVKQYLKDHGLPEAKDIGDVMNCVYRSLATKYAENITKLEKLTGKTYDRIYIVGGGSRDTYLNRLTAEFTGKKVFAGPSEATAIGNIAAQLTAHGIFRDLSEATKAVPTPVQVD